ncbi:uncharacterized protein PpBr36_11459 [Pyricularia pennisetigena]|nr:uncharacterized protein PpBr36_11459 [Pyricularia pennisetigena]TLS20261.1 hypothetical protein PpBr36_11459 [Pyricularia pennisetigena]
MGKNSDIFYHGPSFAALHQNELRISRLTERSVVQGCGSKNSMKVQSYV